LEPYTSGLIVPSEVAGSTYNTSGTGVGSGVEGGKDVAVGITVGAVVAATDVDRAADPHPETKWEINISPRSLRYINHSGKSKLSDITMC
jgi:hypothetical protein